MNHFSGKLFYIAMILSLFSCNIINPEEPIPSFIKVTEYQLIDNPNLNEGSISNKITDGWVYVDNELMGAFEIPFTIPLLKEGVHNISIRAGIMLNGIASTRVIYPFYAAYDTTITLTADQTVTILPVFSYRSDAKITFLEDFESSGLKLERSGTSDTTLIHIKNNPVVFEGTGCGAGFIGDNMLFEIASTTTYSLPKSDLYLELNYKNEIGFTAGVIANEFGQNNYYGTGLLINPSANWNKMYVDLAAATVASQNALNFKLYISAFKTADGTVQSMYIDNVKIVHW